MTNIMCVIQDTIQTGSSNSKSLATNNHIYYLWNKVPRQKPEEEGILISVTKDEKNLLHIENTDSGVVVNKPLCVLFSLQVKARRLQAMIYYNELVCGIINRRLLNYHTCSTPDSTKGFSLSALFPINILQVQQKNNISNQRLLISFQLQLIKATPITASTVNSYTKIHSKHPSRAQMGAWTLQVNWTPLLLFPSAICLKV